MNFLRLSEQEVLSCDGKLVFSRRRKSDFGGAYELSEKCKITLELPRQLGAKNVDVLIYDESLSQIKCRLSAEWKNFSGIYDIFTIKLDTNKLGVGLFFGSIKINTVIGDAYAVKFGDTLSFSKSFSASAFQLSVSEFIYDAPTHKYGGIIYHIFVDRFNRGGECPLRDDAVFVKDWDSEIPEYPAYPGAYLENNSFFGGTLYGITEKLDYIASLGVNTIYLSPIFKAYSNHKYDTGDYMQVDEMFGGEPALKNLIEEAKKRGIGIILDGVFNHTGADSLYFNKFGKYQSVGAYQSKESPYYSWYDFQSHPDKYTAWWGIGILPRINPNISSCGDFFTSDGGVVEKYAKMGIDGFRLDVADELSDEFISKIKQRLNKENKNSVLYGEVWEDASNKIAYETRKKYYLGKELDGVMNYPLRRAIISYVKDRSCGDMEYLFKEIFPNAPKRIRDAQMNLLGTHDTERILTVLGGEASLGKPNDYLCRVRMSESELKLGKLRLMSAYTIAATLPGIPAIFYGDEAGLEGYQDPFNRRTYPWGREAKDILCFYRKIGKIRKNNSVYAEGDFKLLLLSPDLLIFERYNQKTRLITVINNSENTVKLNFTKEAKALINPSRGKLILIPPLSSEIINTLDNTVLTL